MKTLILFFCLFVACFYKAVFGAWVLEVELQSITIFHQVTFNEESEDGPYCCCDKCDDYCFSNISSIDCSDESCRQCQTIITICLIKQNATNTMREQCHKTSETFRSGFKEFVNTFLSTSGQKSYVVVMFAGDNYPSNGTVDLEISVDDNDNGELVKMDTVRFQLNFETLSNETGNPVKYITDEALTELTIASRFYCAKNYYGQTCEELMTTTTTTEPPQVAESSTCIGWRISTVVLILLVVFTFGMCCASAILLIFLRKSKVSRNKSRNINVAYDHQSESVKQVNLSGIHNPVYDQKHQATPTKKKDDLDDYIPMRSSSCNNNDYSDQPDGGNIRSMKLDLELQEKSDEHYEIMSNQGQGRYGMRSNFERLGTPASDNKAGFGHTYEQVDHDDNKDEEYAKLKH